MNFCVASQAASAVELCLFDAADPTVELRRLPLPGRTKDVWHGRLEAAGPGLLYGYRVHGAWDPARGRRFDPNKLLVDPYARALSGPVIWDEALAARPGDSSETPDTAAFVPRGVVVDPAFDWGDDAPPLTPWSRTVLYECHVKGMTQRHPEVPETRRGRYLGLCSAPVIAHLQKLGVTTLCLLPVHHSATDSHVGRLGLTNYWGYGTLGFFAPDARFASGGAGEQVREFCTMIRELHRAGLEVVLDVVYNHTPETDLRGATLCLRGLDDAAYYRFDPSRPGEYVDFSGCGNTLDLSKPRTLELVLDSLRYWVEQMHVDGFRFDLGAALARDGSGRFDPGNGLFAQILRDPVLSKVKLVAEPWDLGPDPNQQGAFPAGISEWNGRFRDSVRRYWRGDPGSRAELATRLAGSADLFGARGRGPHASVNFVTCHDGMTLTDLVSYEQPRYGPDAESPGAGGDRGSANWGVEGPTQDGRVTELRRRARRNLMTTLALSLGVPMLSQGDELLRTQRGHPNPYCHDSELTWVDWRSDPERSAFADFVRQVFAVRRGNAVFRRSRHFDGEALSHARGRDVSWLLPDGRELTEADWKAPGYALGVIVAADAPAREGAESMAARSALLLINGGPSVERFALPPLAGAGSWVVVVDTAAQPAPGSGDGPLEVAAHSMVVLEWDRRP